MLALACVWAAGPLQAAPPVHKCTTDGVVSYQSTPCRVAGEPSPRPTAAQLNAERQKKLRQQAAASAPVQPSAAAVATPAAPAAPVAPAGRAAPAAPVSPAQARFQCDGRTHCSQMRSCAEAKYFLAHCPGVQMDGDKNGIPCERQWCNP